MSRDGGATTLGALRALPIKVTPSWAHKTLERSNSLQHTHTTPFFQATVTRHAPGVHSQPLSVSSVVHSYDANKGFSWFTGVWISPSRSPLYPTSSSPGRSFGGVSGPVEPKLAPGHRCQTGVIGSLRSDSHPRQHRPGHLHKQQEKAHWLHSPNPLAEAEEITRRRRIIIHSPQSS